MFLLKMVLKDGQIRGLLVEEAYMLVDALENLQSVLASRAGNVHVCAGR